LQEHQETRMWKSKDLADQIELSSRCVSGTMRKLVNDGFCDKIGANPIIYCLTEKGKNYKIID
jgi:predicted transcriptional regulator